MEWRLLKSCDYGAPTTRLRFYLIARCDGKPIVFPEPTHGDRHDPKVRAGELAPYRTAATALVRANLPEYCGDAEERKR